MVNISIDNFDIAQIADSGQCFRMNPHKTKPNTYSLIAFGIYIEVEQKPVSNTVTFHGVTEKDFETIWTDYFDLQTNYSDIIHSVDSSDRFLMAATNFGRGIRILHQDLWETIISFMISQNNNIPRIKRSIEILCETCGERRENFNGESYYCFPTPERLTDINNLAPARLGYRDEYVASFARSVASGDIVLSDIRTKEQLLKIRGIGEKVASCIFLFGLHNLSGFPIDVWMKRVIKEYYNGSFPVDRYSEHAGVIQQYIFNYVIHKEGEK